MFPKYPSNLDENVIRAVASVTVLTVIIVILQPELAWLMYFLNLDFMLRYINPRLSPIAKSMKWINFKALKNPPLPTFAPPKRFAVLIGFIFTSTLSISLILEIELLFRFMLIGMAIASGLQSWFNYCVGCRIYDYLVKLHIIRRGEHISRLTNSLVH